jgi:hypothetical protein
MDDAWADNRAPDERRPLICGLSSGAALRGDVGVGR